MRVKPLPKRWLIHSITYQEKTDRKDSYGNPLFADPVEIKNVRFDNSTVFSRDSTQTKIVAEGIIFVDSKHSSPIPDFVEESKITFNGKDYTLKKIVPLYYPMSVKIHHFELEVV